MGFLTDALRGGHQTAPTDPEAPALDILQELHAALDSPRRALEPIFRRARHAFEMLGWKEQRDWFDRELGGYPALSVVPEYRLARGELWWVLEEGLKLNESSPPIREPYARQVREPLQWIVSRSSDILAYQELTNEKRAQWPDNKILRAVWRGRATFEVSSFSAILASIRQEAFRQVSNACVRLQYGNAIGDIWTGYRRRVDRALQGVRLDKNLQVIESGLRKGDSASLAAAVFACRSLLEELSGYLWRDPRDVYEHLPGSSGGKLKVTKDKSVNRIAAYLHQKGLSGSNRELVTHETEHLAAVVRSLVSLEGKAHGVVTLADAQAVALATYFVIGEIAIHTDMKPVEKYHCP